MSIGIVIITHHPYEGVKADFHYDPEDKIVEHAVKACLETLQQIAQHWTNELEPGQGKSDAN